MISHVKHLFPSLLLLYVQIFCALIVFYTCVLCEWTIWTSECIITTIYTNNDNNSCMIDVNIGTKYYDNGNNNRLLSCCFCCFWYFFFHILQQQTMYNIMMFWTNCVCWFMFAFKVVWITSSLCFELHWCYFQCIVNPEIAQKQNVVH